MATGIKAKTSKCFWEKVQLLNIIVLMFSENIQVDENANITEENILNNTSSSLTS